MTPEEIEATLVTVRFLGCSVRVAPLLATVLARVETTLHDEWTRAQLALPGGAPVQAFEGMPVRRQLQASPRCPPQW